MIKSLKKYVRRAESFFKHIGLRDWGAPHVYLGKNCTLSDYSRQDDGQAEICLSKDWRNDLFHEYGHHLVDQFDLTHKAVYRSVFKRGWPRLYMVRVHIFLKLSYLAIKYKFGAPAGKVSWYACVCDEEDFCECISALIEVGGISDRHIREVAETDSLLEEKLKAVRRILLFCAKQ